MATRITLTPPEMMTWAQAGVWRRVSAITKKRASAPTYDGQYNWEFDIQGALAEASVAKFFGLYWSVGMVGADDVGRWQVRWTVYDNGRLPVHPSDPNERAFILVTGTAPNYVIHGWIYGHEAKNPQWWQDPRKTGHAAYFVPQNALHSIETLEINRDLAPLPGRGF